MKQEFWKHKSELIFWIFILISSFIIIISSVLLMFKSTEYWPLLLSGGLLLCLCLYLFFVDKRVLSKIIFSQNGLEIKYFNKTKISLLWNDINHVEETIRSRGLSWLTLISQNTKVDVELTQKMYSAIMILCPKQSIKSQINRIECFKWFHREK